MRADRLVSMLLLLQNRGRMTARSLAAELDVSERTVYRDVEALCAAGVPISSELGPGGGFGLPRNYRTSLTGLTEPEVRTLFVSGAPRLLADLGLGGALDMAMLKLAANLPLAQRNDAERVRQRVHLDPCGWFQAVDAVPLLPTVQEAVWKDRQLQIIYRKAGGEVMERLIHPYGLVAKAGVWYLVGASGGETRVFRISRMREASLVDGPCDRPDSFDLAEYWTSWCAWFENSRPYYPVTLRVSPAGVPLLSSALGEWVQELVDQAPPADSEGWVTLSVTFGSMERARAVMLGLGPQVEVLAPLDLRDGLVETARQTWDFYAGRSRA